MKIVHEWNGCLEIFSLPQAIENSTQFCFSKQIFYRKQSLGALEQSGWDLQIANPAL